MNTRVYKSLLCSIIALLLAAATTVSAQPNSVSADIVSTEDHSTTLGIATLNEVEGDGVTLTLSISANDVISGGDHAIHIHEVGSCQPGDSDDDGTEEPGGAAGGHYNPTDVGHGEDNGPHVGDSEAYNYAFNDDGSFSGEVTFPLASLEGENPVLDDDGSAVMIHAGVDDKETDPGGDAGSRIACGVIMAQGMAETGGETGGTMGGGETGGQEMGGEETGGEASSPQVTTSESNTFKPAQRDFSEELMNSLELPEGFTISVFAEGFTRPRMMAQGPDGRVYVTLNATNEVAILQDTDGDGVSDSQTIQGDLGDLSVLHGIEIVDGSIYLAGEKKVVQASLAEDGSIGELSPIVENLPDGDQHAYRTLAQGPDGMLYLDSGSSCNACLETNPENAAVLRFNTDGSGREIFASGLRNTQGFDWQPTTGQMWGADHGIDHHGNDEPPEEINLLIEGNDYGWPYCYADQVANTAIPYPAPQGYGTIQAYCEDATTGTTETYQAHSAPINLKFYEGDMFPEEYQGDAFVTMRGSWNRYPATGYKVVRLDFDESGELQGAEDFVSSWLIENGTAHFGRVAGLLVLDDGSLLISEDTNGVIYRVSYDGTQASN